jgi:hypothetical protein
MDKETLLKRFADIEWDDFEVKEATLIDAVKVTFLIENGKLLIWKPKSLA